MNEQMEKEKCIFCKHFTVKIMLNGYSGMRKARMLHKVQGPL